MTLGALAPARESRVNTLCARRIGEFNQPGKAPGRQIQSERAYERMVEVGLFPDGERRGSTNQRTQPSLQKLDVRGGGLQPQRIKSGGHSVLERKIHAAQGTH